VAIELPVIMSGICPMPGQGGPDIIGPIIPAIMVSN
jgi:hypothetical protein